MSKRLVAIEPDDGKTLYVTWQTSDTCNYRCSYCNEGNWGGRQPNIDLTGYQATIGPLIVHQLSRGYDRVKLFLSGGEPTHWPILRDICHWFDDITAMKTTKAINTNLSRPLSWWEQHHTLFDDVVASYHPGWAKHDRFMENIIYLQDKVNYLAVRIMMAEESWDEMLCIADQIWDALDNVWLEYVPILDEMSPSTKPYAYRDDAKQQWFKHTSTRCKQLRAKPNNRVGNTVTMERYADGTLQSVNSNRLIADGLNFFRGWQCDVGSSINIGINGDVTFATCGQGATIGNINRHEMNWEDFTSIVCDKSHCHCGTDICIPKRRLT